jgi:hypothetical protein
MPFRSPQSPRPESNPALTQNPGGIDALRKHCILVSPQFRKRVATSELQVEERRLEGPTKAFGGRAKIRRWCGTRGHCSPLKMWPKRNYHRAETRIHLLRLAGQPSRYHAWINLGVLHH